MKDLLGHSIENASEHHAVINVKVGVQENFQNMQSIVADTFKIGEEQRETLQQIPNFTLQEITQKLVKNHQNVQQAQQTAIFDLN